MPPLRKRHPSSAPPSGATKECLLSPYASFRALSCRQDIPAVSGLSAQVHQASPSLHGSIRYRNYIPNTCPDLKDKVIKKFHASKDGFPQCRKPFFTAWNFQLSTINSKHSSHLEKGHPHVPLFFKALSVIIILAVQGIAFGLSVFHRTQTEGELVA